MLKHSLFISQIFMGYVKIILNRALYEFEGISNAVFDTKLKHHEFIGG